MNSKRIFTGDELEQIYHTDKSNALLTEPDNLKILLNHALNKKDKIDSNFDTKIIDFCVDGLESQVPIDEERITFMKEKQDFITREQEKRCLFHSVRKMAAAAAIFVVIVGGMLFGNTVKAEAGLFDWISRLFATVKEKGGEQLSFSTPDTTLTAIECEEGHLPDTLPEGFAFDRSYSENITEINKYDYHFKHSDNDTLLTIQILEYTNPTLLSNNETEINKESSFSTKDKNNTYYYSSNMDSNSISWIYNNNVYRIQGVLSFEILDTVLSCYKEDQQ